jgi:hypothetical protein
LGNAAVGRERRPELIRNGEDESIKLAVSFWLSFVVRRLSPMDGRQARTLIRLHFVGSDKKIVKKKKKKKNTKKNP